MRVTLDPLRRRTSVKRQSFLSLWLQEHLRFGRYKLEQMGAVWTVPGAVYLTDAQLNLAVIGQHTLKRVEISELDASALAISSSALAQTLS